MRKMVGLIGIIASGLLLSLEIYMLKALPHHSTRADWRENLCRKKAQNRRNTLCIARFCNAFVGQIGRQDVRGELCGVALSIEMEQRLSASFFIKRGKTYML